MDSHCISYISLLGLSVYLNTDVHITNYETIPLIFIKTPTNSEKSLYKGI